MKNLSFERLRANSQKNQPITIITLSILSAVLLYLVIVKENTFASTLLTVGNLVLLWYLFNGGALSYVRVDIEKNLVFKEDAIVINNIELPKNKVKALCLAEADKKTAVLSFPYNFHKGIGVAVYFDLEKIELVRELLRKNLPETPFID